MHPDPTTPSPPLPRTGHPDTPGRFHPFGRSHDQDLQLLADGAETGWWDDTGCPAPWPQDFLDPAAGWSAPAASAARPIDDDPDNPPF